MNKTHLILILFIILLIFIYLIKIICGITEKLNNMNVYSNYKPDTGGVPFNNEYDLLVPDKQNTYNPYDSNRPLNTYGHQTDDPDLGSKVDGQTLMVNTTGDTPVVYSLDELETTGLSIYTPTNSPSLPIIPEDAGSGNVYQNIEVNNNNPKLYYLKSIE
jgi:hypothetical protein